MRTTLADLTIEALRRERRRLDLMKLGARLVGWSELVFVMVLLVGFHRRDFGLFAMFFHGTLSNLSVIPIYKVRAIPRLVLALVDADPAVRAHAATVIEAHRTEVLAETDLPAHRDDPELVDMDIAAIAERVTRSGPHADWRRIGRWWLTAWSVALVAVVLGTVAIV